MLRMLPGITVCMIRPVAINWSYAVGGDAKPPEILRQIPGVVSDSRLRCPILSPIMSVNGLFTAARNGLGLLAKPIPLAQSIAIAPAEAAE
jgi:hypothetical protein